MHTQNVYDEVFDAQQHYRLILDSMACPGKINVIPKMEIGEPDTINNASTLIAFALLNTDASFYTADREVTDFVALHTSAVVEQISQADFVFGSGMTDSEFITQLKTGTLEYPENSATVIADVTQISETKISGAVELKLQGPGVKDTATVYLNGLNTDILNEIKEQNLEFPLGIDLILTDTGNRMICIPRSNNFTYAHIL